VRQYSKYFRYYFEAIGSGFEVELLDGEADLQQLVKKFENEVRKFEKRFSRFLRESEVGVLNCNLNKWISVSNDFLDIIKLAEKHSKITNGFFSIGVDAALSAMGYGLNKLAVDQEFLIEIEGNKVKTNSTVDLGGIGKGLVLDMAKSVFGKLAGICVNAGGDFYVSGLAAEQKPWKIFLENPFDIEEIIGEIEIDNELFLASSNTQRRRWSKGHHLINPKLKQLADDMAGVYVQARSGEVADVYSTALFAMGYQKAKSWLEKYNFLEAMLISPEGTVFKTKGFTGELYLKT
jgi:thiamine biosynthesis lipoprotein